MINYLLIDLYSPWMCLVFLSGELIEGGVFSSTLVLDALLDLFWFAAGHKRLT